MAESWGTTTRILGVADANLARIDIGCGWVALTDDGGVWKEERSYDNTVVTQRAHRASW